MTIEFPGLFDVQVNGFAGIDFNRPGLGHDELDAAARAMRATGVTRFLPTLIRIEGFGATLAYISDHGPGAEDRGARRE